MWRIPFVQTDAVKEHVGWPCAEPAGEDLAVVSEDLLGDPVGGECLEQRVTHGARSGAGHNLGDDAEAGVVVDAGDDRDPHPGGQLDVA